MIRAAILLALVACGTSNEPTPDAMVLDPAGTWSMADFYQTNTCGLPASTNETISIVDDRTGYQIGIQSTIGEQLQPGATVTCDPSSCSTSFAVAWVAGQTPHYREYTIQLVGNSIDGGGKETVSNCIASFSVKGSR